MNEQAEQPQKEVVASAVDGFTTQEAVLELILDSWNDVNKKGDYAVKKGVGAAEGEPEVKKEEKKEKKKSTSWFSWGKKAQCEATEGGYNAEANAEAKGAAKQEKQFDIPETFPDMVKLNAAMTGANVGYIDIMLDEFDNLVTDTCRMGQLQEQTDILAMRIAKDVKGVIKTSEFKVCMLAAMRSLIPKRWDTMHEKAWAWIWDSIDTQLKLSLALPNKYEGPVTKFISELDPTTMGDIGLKVWFRMFEKEPAVENVFKQSNERLKWIAIQAMLYSAAIYRDPTSMNIQMQQLGLKHIMFRVNPAYFALFVQCIDEELKERCDDENTINGINWSLTVIACILARTVESGSTPLLLAALNNDVKGLKYELSIQQRGKRGMSMLQA
jgi:hemoglobin-like flavoprotein